MPQNLVSRIVHKGVGQSKAACCTDNVVVVVNFNVDVVVVQRVGDGVDARPKLSPSKRNRTQTWSCDCFCFCFCSRCRKGKALARFCLALTLRRKEEQEEERRKEIHRSLFSFSFFSPLCTISKSAADGDFFSPLWQQKHCKEKLFWNFRGTRNLRPLADQSIKAFVSFAWTEEEKMIS